MIQGIPPRVNHPNAAAVAPLSRPAPDKTPNPAITGGLSKENMASLKDAAMMIQRIKIAAQHELEMARKMRDDASRYQQEAASRARSEAQQLMLKVRLAAQRETEELVRLANEEIQKVLADIRMIRIMAQEELAAQRKFTDAARLHVMSLAIDEKHEKAEARKKRTPAPAE